MENCCFVGFFSLSAFGLVCPPFHHSYCLEQMVVIPSLDTATGRIVAKDLCYFIKKQERTALSLFAHQQLNKCGSKGTVFAWYRFFFSSSGARKLSKLIFNSQPSSRVFTEVVLSTVANRLLCEKAESEVHEENALCYLLTPICLYRDIWIYSGKMLLLSDTKQGFFYKVLQ